MPALALKGKSLRADLQVPNGTTSSPASTWQPSHVSQLTPSSALLLPLLSCNLMMNTCNYSRRIEFLRGRDSQLWRQFAPACEHRRFRSPSLPAFAYALQPQSLSLPRVRAWSTTWETPLWNTHPTLPPIVERLSTWIGLLYWNGPMGPCSRTIPSRPIKVPARANISSAVPVNRQ
jgi:hypothetical protein